MSARFKLFQLILVCVVLALMFGALPNVHAQSDTLDSPPPPVRALGTLIKPDGSLDQSSGFSGSLDAKGWSMTTAADGAPRFVPAEPQAAGDEQWDDRFGPPGFNWQVNAKIYAIATAPNGDIYAGGNFSAAGGVEAANIARWDGRRWQPLGAGLDGPVYALALSGDKLYVGGNFTHVGTIIANSLAVWDLAAETWGTLGGAQGPKDASGFRASIYALAVIGDDIYIGGNIATIDGVVALGVARWNLIAQQWAPLGRGLFKRFGGGLLPGVINALAPTPDGRLYVTGTFESAGNASDLMVNPIAVWDPATGQWEALGSGLITSTQSAPVAGYAIVVSDNAVYVGGQFTEAGGVAANSIARWDTTTQAWSALGSGANNRGAPYGPDPIFALSLVNHTLYVGGSFNSMGGILARDIAGWDIATRTWAELAGGIESYYGVKAIASTGDGGIYVGGEFTRAGNNVAYAFAEWSGSAWSAFGQGVFNVSVGGTGILNAVAVHPSGQVYVGGRFSHVGGMPASNIAMWDGTGWSALGSGTNNAVLSLAVKGDEVYVGGAFNQAGGISANYIASWNRATRSWSALGSGTNGAVATLAIGPSQALYAGGNFTSAGSVEVPRIAIWNLGTHTWNKPGAAITGVGYILTTQKGEPFCSTVNNTIHALLPDAKGVYIGGDINCLVVEKGFVPINGLFYWNQATDKVFDLGRGVTRQGGTTGPVSGIVRALGLSDDGRTLYVGGEFDKAGTVAAAGIARLDSTGWAALGDSVGGVASRKVLAIEVIGADVYVGGKFTAAGATSANYIARWNAPSESWSALGSGVSLPRDYYDGVKALATWRESLFVGGDFETAGSNPSYGFAIWNQPAVSGNVTAAAGGAVSSGDGLRIQFPAGAVPQDVTLRYQAQFAPSFQLEAGHQVVRSFTLDARTLDGVVVTRFSQPYTLQVDYSEAQLATLGIGEASVTLAYWNGSAWVDMLPCPGCSLDTANNRIIVVADHFTEFALLGQPSQSAGNRIYLPLVVR